MYLSLGLLDRPGREGQAQAHQARPGLALSVRSRDGRTGGVSSRDTDELINAVSPRQINRTLMLDTGGRCAYI